ncbi:hypothetical protein ACLB2K_037992 [Fragaria x ananassa]
MLRKYIADPSHVLQEQPISLQKDLTYDEEPVQILDQMEQVFGDSLLVVNQLVAKFKCLSSSIDPYLRKEFDILDQFDDVHIERIPHEFNFVANELAQIASGLSLREGVRERLLKV